MPRPRPPDPLLAQPPGARLLAREIASLAAQGLASKTIGERLFVTSRTVDNHLARIYTKLGVGSRAELADALSTQ